MENKKLVKILQRDMTELEELISDVKNQGSFNPLEMDFIHSRAKGLMQLVQLLKVEDENGSHDVQVPIPNETLEEIKETVTEIQDEVNENTIEEETAPEPEKQIKETEEEVADVVKNEPDERDAEAEVSEEQQAETEVEEAKPTDENEDNDDEMLEEETEKSEANSRLGDSFLKGRSLNDLVTDQNKLEFKLSNRPVRSIKTAIGINDRFQYIRELFEGDAEKFAETVNELDSKQNLKDAVDYLRHNFRWKKNETSLKFVNLVKRRFQHE